MRGKRVSAESRKVDVVIDGARYTPDGRLSLARGWERRGEVWGDWVLFDRDQLIGHLRRGKRVVIGRAGELPGDFVVEVPVQLLRSNGFEVLLVHGKPTKNDDLGVPLF